MKNIANCKLYLYVILSMLLIAGCQEFIVISVNSVNSEISFELEKKIQVCNFSVMRYETPEQKSGTNNEILWEIEPTNKCDKSLSMLKKITYGIVPKGFRQIVTPEIITTGTYYLTVDGRTNNIYGGMLMECENYNCTKISM